MRRARGLGHGGADDKDPRDGGAGEAARAFVDFSRIVPVLGPEEEVRHRLEDLALKPASVFD